MIIVYYYIGMLIGVAVVLLCNFAARWATRAKRGSMCDKCKGMRFKDWKGKKWCSKKGWFYFNPRYCAQYEEREDAND